MDIRVAATTDLDTIIQLDPIAQREPTRVEFIRRSLLSECCLVAVADGRIVAYGVLDYSFFNHAYISMLYVEPHIRRRGIGSALIRRMEAASKDQKLFTSTNESNKPMQALLDQFGYERSGIVENLDEADPELIYFKELGKRTG